MASVLGLFVGPDKRNCDQVIAVTFNLPIIIKFCEQLLTSGELDSNPDADEGVRELHESQRNALKHLIYESKKELIRTGYAKVRPMQKKINIG